MSKIRSTAIFTKEDPVSDKIIHMDEIFGPVLQEKEVVESLKNNPGLYYRYTNMEAGWRQRLIDFLRGTKSLPITYDPFFKRLFHPDVHSDRLECFISSLLGRKVRVEGVLPMEEVLLEGGKPLVMDILVQLEDGAFALVEIQKIPYQFPAERVSCTRLTCSCANIAV